MKAKFGTARASKRRESRARGHSDPMDVDAINSLAARTEKRKRIIESTRRLGAVESVFRETALIMSHHAKALARKANRTRHARPKSAGKGKDL